MAQVDASETAIAMPICYMFSDSASSRRPKVLKIDKSWPDTDIEAVFLPREKKTMCQCELIVFPSGKACQSAKLRPYLF
jgi:hypothetical protein